MNVWLLPSAFHPAKGGVEEATLQLARHLLEDGHRVTVVTNRHPRSLDPVEVVEGVRTVRVRFDAPRADLQAAIGFPFSLGGSLLALLREHPPPDIVHVQCVSTQTAAALSFARARRVPLVVTTQGEVEMDADAIFEKSIYMRTLFRLSARLAAELTACSTWAASSASRLAHPFCGARVIPNGIDPQQWRIASVPSEPIVAAWGRHVWQKGFDLLFDAWPRVIEAVPSAQLLLGGSGPESDALRMRAPARTTFVGPIDRPGVNELLARSRVVVVPSRLEPFGIVSLEAMASGRQVVWSTRGGMVDAMRGSGWPVDPTEPESLARSIVQALSSDLNPSALRRHALGFSWERLTKRYVNAYESALWRGRRRAGGPVGGERA